MLLPDRETIHKLLKGELAPEDAGAVFRQLDDQLAFNSVVAGLVDDHTFLDLLHNASVLLTQAPNSELDRLIRRFRASGASLGTIAGSGLPSEKPTGTLFQPHTIGGFEILAKLGEGGMGAVFLAEDTGLKRRVALKVMRPEVAAIEESRDRFLLEAQAAARIEHDNVVDIYQVGLDGGAPFIVMPLLEGQSLEDRLRHERISSVPMVLKVGREVALGLEAAHARKLIHRDIKPANLWLEGDSNSDRGASRFRRTKILDFGLARCLESSIHPTRSGAILGSPLFMAPEQGHGKPADARSDLFSLGVVLYRMATGEQPFKGETIMAVLTSLATHQPLAPNISNPDLPVEVSSLIVRLMQRNPEERYQSAREVVADIEGIIRAIRAKGRAGTSGPVPISKPNPLAKPERVVVSFPTEILPPAESLAPSLELDPPPKSRLVLWLALVASGLVLLTIVLAVMSSFGASKTTRVAPTRSPDAPTLTAIKALEPVRNEPPTSKGPIAGEVKSFEIATGVTMEFCWIPAGECQLGSPKEERAYLVKTQLDRERQDWLDGENESTRGKYKSKGFWLGKYPVTQGEYESVVGSNPSKFKGDRLPVETVSWEDAQACIKKMNEGEAGKALRKVMGEKARFSLPHEDAWEYACRGALGNERAYYWGDTLNGDKANCDWNYPYGTETKGANLEKTSEVGAYERKAKHPWGLCDMSGNVHQWCDNWYSSEQKSRVLRGGSWDSFSRYCRSANRGYSAPANRDFNFGFRVSVMN